MLAAFLKPLRCLEAVNQFLRWSNFRRVRCLVPMIDAKIST